MKKLFFTVFLVLTTSMASAKCYNFVNGNGPNRLGNFQFGRIAQTVCVTLVHGFAGYYPSIAFSVQEGTIALAAGNILHDSNLPSSFTLASGQIFQNNVNLNGINISLTSMTYDPRINLETGVLGIQFGRGFVERYLISEKKNY